VTVLRLGQYGQPSLATAGLLVFTLTCRYGSMWHITLANVGFQAYVMSYYNPEDLSQLVTSTTVQALPCYAMI